ncbi:hypothetical protein Ddye_024713 [Dipteronia dyeriana]|uniref:Endonuclease/exonuclease/phosphatase domain-containing protein n=1 Tax=Dipteronia dyeriana TaxID=168575 RepID=A0AAD9TVD4_9ROSI|nr:hypothetical protein Ddye_024713 [Dipteronia dyeriana]
MTTTRSRGESIQDSSVSGTTGCRSRTKRVTWKLVEELAKVVEKGVEANNRGDSEWDLDEEVTRVLETGAALGLDFNGNEVEISRIVNSMKREDEESKLAVFDSSIVRSIGGVFLTRGVGVDAKGSAGGLITLWNEDLFLVSHCISNKWCIVLVGVLFKIDKEVILCNVYAPNVEADRKKLWGFLLNIQQSFSSPWCIGGDFNTVLFASERK